MIVDCKSPQKSNYDQLCILYPHEFLVNASCAGVIYPQCDLPTLNLRTTWSHCATTRKFGKPLRKHILLNHPLNCSLRRWIPGRVYQRSINIFKPSMVGFSAADSKNHSPPGGSQFWGCFEFCHGICHGLWNIGQYTSKTPVGSSAVTVSNFVDQSLVPSASHTVAAPLWRCRCQALIALRLHPKLRVTSPNVVVTSCNKPEKRCECHVGWTLPNRRWTGTN